MGKNNSYALTDSVDTGLSALSTNAVKDRDGHRVSYRISKQLVTLFSHACLAERDSLGCS